MVVGVSGPVLNYTISTVRETTLIDGRGFPYVLLQAVYYRRFETKPVLTKFLPRILNQKSRQGSLFCGFCLS